MRKLYSFGSLLCWLCVAAISLPAVGSADQSNSSPASGGESLPESVDLRPIFVELGLTPRDQGARSTCSVFTMVGGLEFAIAKAEGHGQRLSVDFLNWAANQSRRPADGGFFSDMWRGFSAEGICSEARMPYSKTFDYSRKPDADALSEAKTRLQLQLDHHWIKKWNVTTGLSEEEFLEIKHTLKLGWPVCAGFRWPKSPLWQKHALQMCPPEEVFDGHSILLVGYRDDPSLDGGGALIFHNSNGGGADGLMPYTYAKTYMNDALWIKAPSKPGA